VPHGKLMIFSDFLPFSSQDLALTRASTNPLVLFLFIPCRDTNSKGFPEETPAKLLHHFLKSAVKTQMDIFLG
jgi:hypothetical protein